MAELSISACRLYRVDNKAAALQHLGHRVVIVDWTKPAECREAIQLCDLLILYRVGAHPHVEALLKEASRLSVTTLFEIDDLVFDEVAYGAEPSLLARPLWEQRSILDGVALYRQALLACDHAVASTEPLAAAVRSARSNKGETFVVENAPSHHMLWLADRIRRHPLKQSGSRLVIGYGSGTRTHDADLALVVPALVEVLGRFPEAEIALHGALAVPDALRTFGARVRQVPLLNYDDYLRAVALWDVSLAPLHRSLFTEGKSNIKFLEAALVEVPSVCTPTEPFRRAIEPGVNGLLADTTEDWVAALSTLLSDADLRQQMGTRSLATVLDRHHPDHVAETQLSPTVDRLLHPSSRARVLVADAAPTASHGELVQSVCTLGSLDVRTLFLDEPAVLQEVGAGSRLRRAIVSSAVPRCDAVSFQPSKLPEPGQYWNVEVAEAFARVAESWQPDLVIVGDLSRLGVSILHESLSRHIPYIVVLRDEWWLHDPALRSSAPARASFMAHDLRDAADHSGNPELVYHRYFELRELLLQAAKLVPSDDRLRCLYLSHNLPEDLLHRAGGLDEIVRELTA